MRPAFCFHSFSKTVLPGSAPDLPTAKSSALLLLVAFSTPDRRPSIRCKTPLLQSGWKTQFRQFPPTFQLTPSLALLSLPNSGTKTRPKALLSASSALPSFLPPGDATGPAVSTASTHCPEMGHALSTPATPKPQPQDTDGLTRRLSARPKAPLLQLESSCPQPPPFPLFFHKPLPSLITGLSTGSSTRKSDPGRESGRYSL